MSGNAFDYRKPKKRRLELTEDFDPRPENLRGNANSLLPGPLDSVHGESLGISLLFDQHYCHTTAEIDDVAISDIATLKHSILSFKESCLFMKSMSKLGSCYAVSSHRKPNGRVYLVSSSLLSIRFGVCGTLLHNRTLRFHPYIHVHLSHYLKCVSTCVHLSQKFNFQI